VSTSFRDPRLAELDALIAQGLGDASGASLRRRLQPPVKAPTKAPERAAGNSVVVREHTPYERRYHGPLAEKLQWYWGLKVCFICGDFGHCSHREPLTDIAEIECMERRMARAATKIEYSVPDEKGENV